MSRDSPSHSTRAPQVLLVLGLRNHALPKEARRGAGSVHQAVLDVGETRSSFAADAAQHDLEELMVAAWRPCFSVGEDVARNVDDGRLLARQIQHEVGKAVNDRFQQPASSTDTGH